MRVALRTRSSKRPKQVMDTSVSTSTSSVPMSGTKKPIPSWCDSCSSVSVCSLCWKTWNWRSVRSGLESETCLPSSFDTLRTTLDAFETACVKLLALQCVPRQRLRRGLKRGEGGLLQEEDDEEELGVERHGGAQQRWVGVRHAQQDEMEEDVEGQPG
eukprot:3937176-Rhodomonas_salina.2